MRASQRLRVQRAAMFVAIVVLGAILIAALEDGVVEDALAGRWERVQSWWRAFMRGMVVTGAYWLAIAAALAAFTPLGVIPAVLLAAVPSGGYNAVAAVTNLPALPGTNGGGSCPPGYVCLSNGTRVRKT